MAGLGAMTGMAGKRERIDERGGSGLSGPRGPDNPAAAMFGAASYPIEAISGVFVRAPKTGALMVLAILLMVFAIFNAHGQLAIPAFVVAIVIMVSSYLRPSRLVLRLAGGEKPALESRDRRRLRAIKGRSNGPRRRSPRAQGLERFAPLRPPRQPEPLGDEPVDDAFGQQAGIVQLTRRLGTMA